MNKKKIYTAADFNPMSWGEFGSILSSLTNQAITLNETLSTPIDTIVPVLRSGAIPAYPIAINMGIRTIAPIAVVRGNCTMPEESSKILANARHALLCEVNVVTGKTARNLFTLLSKEYPHLTLSFLAVACAYGTEEKDFNFKHTLIGIRTNEKGVATHDEVTALKLRPGVTLFPWESLELELKEINA